MNRLALGPTTLPSTAPLEYLRAAVAAGYDAVGVRLFRSPGLPFHPVVGDAPLIREMKRVLADASLPVLDNLGRLCDAAARFALTIVIEFVPHRALATLPMALQILAETGRPNGAICPTRCTSLDRGEAPPISRARRPVLPLRAALRRRSRPRRARPRPGQTARDRGALRELLAALPPGIPLSVELPMPAGRHASAEEWARIALENARSFLADLDRSGPG